QPPWAGALRASINSAGIRAATIQLVLGKSGEFVIKVPHQGFEEAERGESQGGVDAARAKIRNALNSFGPEAEATKSLEEDSKAAFKIEGTDAVGQVA